MGWESSGVVGFDLGPLLEGQMRTAKLKSAYNLPIIGPRGFGALSLWWVQFASVFRCARSSSTYSLTLQLIQFLNNPLSYQIQNTVKLTFSLQSHSTTTTALLTQVSIRAARFC